MNVEASPYLKLTLQCWIHYTCTIVLVCMVVVHACHMFFKKHILIAFQLYVTDIREGIEYTLIEQLPLFGRLLY